MTALSMYAVCRYRATACGRNGVSFHLPIASTVSSHSFGSAPVDRFSSTFSISVGSPSRKGRTFQYRSGVGSSLSSVGSKR